jgi:dolichyl-phosphate-mannose-protein mannosyltransferase
VLIVVRVAQRMFGSVVLAAAAGLLMSLDGMHFVLSRSALLDIFVMLFVFAGFACLLLDRDQQRRRWLAALESGVDPDARGWIWLGVPWWRLAAGVMAGCACAVKWSGIWYVLAFVLLVFLWEGGTRRTVGVRHPWLQALAVTAVSGAAYVALAFVTYLAAWTGWFVTDTGWDRHWLAKHGQAEPPVIGALVNLWHYHVEAYDFHTHLTEKHTYQSWPWQWLLLGRPVAFYYSGDVACGAPQCSSEVLLLGTPVLWWFSTLALIWSAVCWVGKRDWRYGIVVVGALVTWLPWLRWDDRPIFSYYAIVIEPFLILGAVLLLGEILGRAPAGSLRRTVGATAAGAIVVAVIVNFAWFWPIYTDALLTHASWLDRIWFQRWI